MRLNVDLNSGLVAEAASEHGGVRVIQSLFGSNQTAVEHRLRGGVVDGQAVDAAAAHQVGAAVANMADPSAGSGGILLQ